MTVTITVEIEIVAFTPAKEIVSRIVDRGCDRRGCDSAAMEGAAIYRYPLSGHVVINTGLCWPEGTESPCI